MNILNNELVRKYFECEDSNGWCRRGLTPNTIGIAHATYSEWAMACMTYRILQAMQEPIKIGESYLYVDSDGTVTERTRNYGAVDWAVHTTCLRLPDRFQKQECCKSHWCEGCNQYLAHKYDPKPAPKPEKCECVAHPDCNACQGDGRAGHCLPKDEVEEKIKEIAGKAHKLCIDKDYESCAFTDDMRKLVVLARKS